MKYQLLQDGSVSGPYTREQILHFHQTGKLNADCQWKITDGNNWHPIAKLSFIHNLNQLENPFDPSPQEQYWSNKLQESRAENGFRFLRDFPFGMALGGLACLGITALFLSPRSSNIILPTTKSAAAASIGKSESNKLLFGLSSKHVSHRRYTSTKAFKPSLNQQNVQKTYTCGSGTGHVKITTYGTELPPIQQKYFADKGIFLVNEFRRITGISPPANFYFHILFFKREADFDVAYRQVFGEERPRGTMGITQLKKGRTINPILTYDLDGGKSETVDVIAHEMIHTLAWVSYGDFPMCFDEGIADWLGYSYRHRIPNVSNFYHRANAIKLKGMIQSRKFPSLSKFLLCESYADWQKLLGEQVIGYQISGMFLDHLWTHHRKFLLNGLAYCRRFPDNIPDRSRAFRNYVGNNWPGGWADLDRRFQNWILDRAKINWQPDQ